MAEQKIIDNGSTAKIVKRVLSSFVNLTNRKEDLTGLSNGLKKDTVFVSLRHSKMSVNQQYVE